MSETSGFGTELICQLLRSNEPVEVMRATALERGAITISLLGKDGVLRPVDPMIIPQMLGLLREIEADFARGDWSAEIRALLARIDSSPESQVAG